MEIEHYKGGVREGFESKLEFKLGSLARPKNSGRAANKGTGMGVLISTTANNSSTPPEFLIGDHCEAISA